MFIARDKTSDSAQPPLEIWRHFCGRYSNDFVIIMHSGEVILMTLKRYRKRCCSKPEHFEFSKGQNLDGTVLLGKIRKSES